MKKFTELNRFHKPAELPLYEKIIAAAKHVLAVEMRIQDEANLTESSIANIEELAERIVTLVESKENAATSEAMNKIRLAIYEGREPGLSVSRELYKIDLSKVTESVDEVKKQIEFGNGFVEVYKVTEGQAIIYGANTDGYLDNTVKVPYEALVSEAVSMLDYDKQLSKFGWELTDTSSVYKCRFYVHRQDRNYRLTLNYKAKTLTIITGTGFHSKQLPPITYHDVTEMITPSLEEIVNAFAVRDAELA